MYCELICSNNERLYFLNNINKINTNEYNIILASSTLESCL